MSSPSSAVSVSNLVKAFDGDTVLDNISLEISPGEVIGYIGPNGAGKSTTIRILTGIIPDFEGDVQVLGFDVKKDPIEVKRRIGYIPENAALYETLTPAEYLHFVGQLYQLSPQQTEKKAQELLGVLGLADHADDRMTTFSKGMRQKVLFVAGLIHNPSVIFLDEPLTGLDANAVILVKEILMQLKKNGKTIFYSSHIMDVVEKISDRIIVINQGKIIANGTFRELNSGAGSASLEKLFTELTGNTDHESAAGDFINILEND